MFLYSTIMAISFIGLLAIAYFQTLLITTDFELEHSSNRILFILFGCIVQIPLLGVLFISIKQLFFS